MGQVYEAEETESGRRVAMKILSRGLGDDEERERFLREGRLAASLSHPNTVYVFGTTEVQGFPVIAMELAPGGTLKELRRRRHAAGAGGGGRRDPPGDRRPRRGRGDRHPAPRHQAVELLRRRDGRVLVGDFGLSMTTLARDEQTLTVAGTILGTPGFASPEQLRGDALDVRSDIYSVGATLYYLLTGRAAVRRPERRHADDAGRDRSAAGADDVPRRTCRRAWPSSSRSAWRRRRASATRATRRWPAALEPFRSAALTPAPLGRRFLAGLRRHLRRGAAGDAAEHVSRRAALDAIELDGLTLLSLPAVALVARLLRDSRRALRVRRRQGAVQPARRSTRRRPRRASAARFVRALIVPACRRRSSRRSWRLLALRCRMQRRAAVSRRSDVVARLRGRTVAVSFVLSRRPVLDGAPAQRLRGDCTTSRPARASCCGRRPIEARQALRRATRDAVRGRRGRRADRAVCRRAPRVKAAAHRRRRRRRRRLRRSPAPPRVDGAAADRHAARCRAWRRDLGRPARTRWLSGRRTDGECWDAYEAVDGQPFLAGGRAAAAVVARPPLARRSGARRSPPRSKDGSLPAARASIASGSASDDRARLLDWAPPSAIDARAIGRVGDRTSRTSARSRSASSTASPPARCEASSRQRAQSRSPSTAAAAAGADAAARVRATAPSTTADASRARPARHAARRRRRSRAGAARSQLAVCAVIPAR